MQGELDTKPFLRKAVSDYKHPAHTTIQDGNEAVSPKACIVKRGVGRD